MTATEREARLRALLAKAKPMTAGQREQQQISFAYGNVKIDEPTISRELIERLVHRR